MYREGWDKEKGIGSCLHLYLDVHGRDVTGAGKEIRCYFETWPKWGGGGAGGRGELNGQGGTEWTHRSRLMITQDIAVADQY